LLSLIVSSSQLSRSVACCRGTVLPCCRDDQDAVNDVMKFYPTLRAIAAKVGSNPDIAAWVKSRPVTKF
jgi:hypothetical protein